MLHRLRGEITLTPTSTRLAEQRTTPVCPSCLHLHLNHNHHRSRHPHLIDTLIPHILTTTSSTICSRHPHLIDTLTPHIHNHFFYHLLQTSSFHRTLIPIIHTTTSTVNLHHHTLPPPPQSVTAPVLLSSILTFHSSLDHIHYSSSNIHTHTTSTIAITST